MRLTYNNENFYFDDSGPSDSKRVILFTTDSNLSILKSNKLWFGDGTFSVAPELFYQLYTINVIIKCKNIPLIYALLPDKCQQTYEKMFQMVIKDFRTEDFPTNLMHDFELGAINSIISLFGGTNIFGCYFHFTQNLWKNMQKKS